VAKFFNLSAILFLLAASSLCQAQTKGYKTWSFNKTWGTYDTRSVLNYVYLDSDNSSGISIGMHKVSKNEELYLTEALIGRKGKGAEVVKPILNTLGASNELEISWKDAVFKIRTIPYEAELLVVIKCIKQTALPVYPTFQSLAFWNASDNAITPKIVVLNGVSRLVINHPRGGSAKELVITEGETATLLVGKTLYSDNIKKARIALREKNKNALQKIVLKFHKLDIAIQNSQPKSLTDSVKAIITNNLAWNTIYDPTKKRVITTVNRIWNVDRGGYVVFCWDNFFGSILWSKVSEAAALANFKNTLQEMTPDGFIPNNSQGNGRAAWDRSQPPVGTIALDQLINIEDSAKLRLLEPEIKQLIRWNNWWWTNRKNGVLLSWGSKEGSVPNKFLDKAWNNRLAAALESGADDSPAYDDVAFDPNTGLLDMHDVALNSLYVRDCELLAKIADKLGWQQDVQQLNSRKKAVSLELEKLWDAKAGIYKNRHVKGDSLSSIITPFNFLPLIAKLATEEQAATMAKKWLTNPAHFGGPFPLPSVDKQHKDYPKQQYWKGATWPPMNYLVWLGLSRYPNLKQEAQWLGMSSKALFMKEYNRKGYVCENYSNISGTCDDGLVKAETNYFWGLLMLIMD